MKKILIIGAGGATQGILKPLLDQSPEKISLTLKELIIRYIESVLVKKRGCVNETIILKAFMRQPFVNKPLIQITAEDFAQYRDQRLEYVKPATLIRELCIVQHLYSTAKKEWSFDIPNPIKNIQKPKLNNRRERRLTKEEYENKLSEINNELNPIMMKVYNGDQTEMPTSMPESVPEGMPAGIPTVDEVD